MQNYQGSIVNGSQFASSHELAVLRMPSVLAVHDVAVSGYSLYSVPGIVATGSDYTLRTGLGHDHNGSDGMILSCETGVVVWSEIDGAKHVIDGRVKAFLIETTGGPRVSFFEEIDGQLHFNATIRCVDLMGMAPNCQSMSRINEYQDLLVAVRLANIAKLH